MLMIEKNCFIFILILSFLFDPTNTQDFDSRIEPEKKCEMKVNCNLPQCNCESTESPINFLKLYRRDEIPQLVVLSIDDDKLDIKSYQVYKRLFDNSSIKATFFVSDSSNETSYCLIRSLYENRNEIAISTVNYTCPRKLCTAEKNFQSWNYEVWTEQILNMRERIHRYSGIAKSEIVGFRAPILEPAADMHYRIIHGNKFLYDSSIVMNNDSMITWPFTLDYVIQSPLNNNGPIGLYPGMWVVPLSTYVNHDNDASTCIKISEGQCKIEKTVKGIEKFFRQHFLRAYYNNRAPVVFHLTADWLKEFVTITETEYIPNVGFSNAEKRKINFYRKEYRNLDGLIKFIQRTLEFNKDVHFVTAQQAIEWMKVLPRIENEKVNFTAFYDEILGLETTGYKQNLDGKCDWLKQPTPDYDDHESLYLDDDSGNKLKKEHTDKLNDTVLAGLQSEVLWVHHEILYFVIAITLAIIFIIIYDHVY